MKNSNAFDDRVKFQNNAIFYDSQIDSENHRRIQTQKALEHV